MTTLWPILAAPFIGSFLGVLIQRLPAGTPVAFARSRCSHCGTALTPRDMLPLISFAALRGRFHGVGRDVIGDRLADRKRGERIGRERGRRDGDDGDRNE